MTIITTTEGLKAGDILIFNKELIGKRDGQPYWWKTFRCVLEVSSTRFASLLILKMNPDPDKDIRLEDFSTVTGQVIEFLPEERIPQGPIAMRMKHIMTGLIVLGDH